MKRILFIVLLFIVACAQTQDPIKIVQTNPTVMEQINKFPNSNVSYYQTAELDNECKHLPAKDYTRVTVVSPETTTVLYLDANDVKCVYQKKVEIIEEVEESYKYPIQNAKISATQSGNNEKTIDVELTEDNIVDSFELTFYPDCQVWRVKELEIYLNDNLIYQKIPSCGFKTRVQVSNLTLGSYKLRFKTLQGDYAISKLRFAGVADLSFSLTTSTQIVTLMDFQDVDFGQVLEFGYNDTYKDPVLSFEAEADGLVKVNFNDRQIFLREIITQPSLKLKDFVQPENKIVFSLVNYDPACDDVSIQLYQHKENPIMCKVPQDSRLQMILRNNGNIVLQQIELFLRGDIIKLETIDLKLAPGLLYTKIINYEELGYINQVVITPILDGDIRCKSLVFTEIKEC